MHIGRVYPVPIRLVWTTLVAVWLVSPCGLAPEQKAYAGPPPLGVDEIVFQGTDDAETQAIAVSPDGSLLAMFIYDSSDVAVPKGAVRLWDMSTRRLRFSGTLGEIFLPDCGDGWNWLHRSVNCLWQVTFSPDGKFLVAGAWGCRTIKSWDVVTGKECLNFSLDDEPSQHCRKFWFSRDGRTLTLDVPREWLIEGADAWIEELVSVDAKSWRVQSRRRIPSKEIYATALATDEKSLLVATQSGQGISRWLPVPIWDPAALFAQIAEERVFDPPVPEEDRGTTPWLTFSPDGSAMFVSRRIVRWVKGKAETVYLEDDHPQDCDSLTFSPDGRLICGIRRYFVELPAARLPRLVKDWLGRFVDIPEYRLIGEVFVWDTATGRCVDFLKRSDWNPRAIAVFSGNEKVAIAGGTDVLVCPLAAK